MTPDQLIETLKWFITDAENLKRNGESKEQDWGSLIDDIQDTFKYVEIEVH